jgi:pentatricopeptide repeat-containing protein PET309
MIMSAFLRQGNRVQAKKLYDEMIERGIQPTRDTYEEIISSYRKEGTPESLRIADEIIKHLDSFPKEDSKDDSAIRLWGPLPTPRFVFAKERTRR